MNDKEIDEAIENNPGGSDLEIALAIGSDEVSVSRRRKLLNERVAKAKEQADKEKARIESDRAKAEAETAKAAKKKADDKTDPGHTKEKPVEYGGNQPPAETAPAIIPPRQKYYLQEESGACIELLRINEGNRNTVMFQRA